MIFILFVGWVELLEPGSVALVGAESFLRRLDEHRTAGFVLDWVRELDGERPDVDGLALKAIDTMMLFGSIIIFHYLAIFIELHNRWRLAPTPKFLRAHAASVLAGI